jgi:hypothetical protein
LDNADTWLVNFLMGSTEGLAGIIGDLHASAKMLDDGSQHKILLSYNNNQKSLKESGQ